MPNLDPNNGKGWLVICTGSGPSSISVDGDGGDGDHGDGRAPVDTHHPGICPFMAVTLLAPVLWLLALLVPLVGPARLRWCGAGTHVWRLLCGPVLGARAPPAAAAA